MQVMDIDAEQALLGAIFVNGSGSDAVPQWLTIVAIATGLAIVHAVLLAFWHPRTYEERDVA